jgi:L-ascorbate metabolism protein UlaG (beta-lactamase superfamily)
VPKTRYYNLDQVHTIRSFREFRQWRKERRRKQKDLTYTVPQAEPKQLAYLQANRTETSITWIGHSTFLIQMGGLNIVTDPVWAKRMGLDKRLTEPGIELTDMPEVDVVLISHSHYDHLHFTTLRRLRGNPMHLVPEGLQRKFAKKGFQRVMEVKWWECVKIGAVTFTMVPAQHWTKRTLTDTNTSHWGGWVMQQTDSVTGKPVTRNVIYFVGDSAYFRGFKEIGERYSIDYALMPIGAYEPEWFMSHHHVSPEQAVQAFLDVKANVFIPMHYSTFRLADDTPREALDRLEAEWKRQGLDPARLKCLKLGETLKIRDADPVSPGSAR